MVFNTGWIFISSYWLLIFIDKIGWGCCSGCCEDCCHFAAAAGRAQKWQLWKSKHCVLSQSWADHQFDRSVQTAGLVSQPCSCKCQNLTAERFDEARTEDKGWKPLSGIGWDRFAQMVAFQPTGSSHICTQRLKQAFLTMQRFWPRRDLDDIVD